MPAEITPSLLARFEPVRLLGRGGGGTVHLVRDRRLGREVALKLLDVAGGAARQAFEDESRILANLEHEHVVRLYDAGIADDSPYIVMEYVRGATLASRLAEGRPTQPEAAQIALDIARGIQAAHARNIVHRDLKPANVFLDESGKAKIADFGIAIVREHAQAQDVEDSRQGFATAGTLGYMAPEQARGDRVGQPADVYAWGIIFYEMLAGRRLFAGSDPLAIMRVQQQGNPRYPSLVNPSVPGELDDLVFQSLSVDAARRPSAPELVTRLGEWLARAQRSRPHGTTVHPERPYKPLQHLDREDSPLFFGRDAQVQELVSTLKSPATRILFLFGPCGIGKSSLLRAGLVPALDPQSHEVVILNSGPDPARSLWQHVSDRLHLRAQGGDARLAPRLHRLSTLFSDWTQDIEKTVVLVIDQLEELVTHNPRSTPRIGAFFEAIQSLVEDTRLPVKIVLSFRTEFRGDLFPLEERLADYQRSYGIREIGEAGLAEAIEGPSHIADYGFGFAQGFPRRLAADILAAAAASGDTALPLMQIVASQLHARMRQSGARLIDDRLYEGLVGGIEGALRRYVEERLADAAYAGRGALARQILKALTMRESGGERFSRARDEEELLDFPDRASARQVLERLTADHLVIREVTPSGTRQVRLASEVVCGLIDAWTLEPDDADRAARVLSRACRIWDEQGRRPEDLLDGPALALVRRNTSSLKGTTEQERLFLESSIARWRMAASWRIVAAGVILLALGSMGWRAFFKPGRLLLDSEPGGATVFHQGRPLGTTPLAWEARPGVYHLRLRRDRHVETTATVQIPAGGEVVHRCTLSYPFGLLAVSSSPAGAVCAIEPGPGTSAAGIPATTVATPFTKELPAGRYTLTLSCHGFAPETLRGVPIGPNRQVTQKAVTLQKNTGFLAIQTLLEGNVLTLWDGRTGQRVLECSLPLLNPLELPAGEYRARCAQKNHATDEQSVRIVSGKTTIHRPWTPWLETISAAIGERPLISPPGLARFDQDGALDIVSTTDRGTLVVGSILKNGRGIWTYPPAGSDDRRLAREGRVEPAAGDLDGDGSVDVVVACRDRKYRALDGSRMGRPMWEHASATEISIPPLVLRGGPGTPLPVIVAASDDTLEGVSGADGKTAWSLRLPGRLTAPLAAGDLDRDGREEVITAITNGRLVAISRGRVLWTHAGGGDLATAPGICARFADPVQAVAAVFADGRLVALSPRDGRPLWKTGIEGAGGLAIDTGDLNGDGVVDVAVPTSKGRIVGVDGRDGKILWTFQSGSNRITGVAVGDVDSDGMADVAFGTGDGQVMVVSGGNGSLLMTCDAKAPVVAAPTLSDIDEDGNLDILVCTSGGTALCVLSPGPHPLWVYPAPGMVNTPPAMGDLDGDGLLDVVFTAERNLVTRSARTGDWYWKVQADASYTTPPALGDLDGDRMCDVVTFLQNGQIKAIAGKDARCMWSFQAESSPESAALVGDLDGDGLPEVMTSAGNGTVTARKGRNGEHLWTCNTNVPPVMFPVLADLDGNGVLDVVVCSRDRSFRGLHGKTGRVLWKIVAGDGGAMPAVGDLDGDGRAELVLWLRNEQVNVFSGVDGHRLWSQAVEGKYALVGVLDADGDGKNDVCTVGSTGRLVVFEGRTGRPIWKSRGVPCMPGTIGLDDLDGDGVADLLVPSADSALNVYSGRSGAHLFRLHYGATMVVPPLVVDNDGRLGSEVLNVFTQRSPRRHPERVRTGRIGFLCVLEGNSIGYVEHRWPFRRSPLPMHPTSHGRRAVPPSVWSELEHAVCRDPKSARARLALARHQARLRRFENAGVEYREALALDPSNSAARLEYDRLVAPPVTPSPSPSPSPSAPASGPVGPSPRSTPSPRR